MLHHRVGEREREEEGGEGPGVHREAAGGHRRGDEEEARQPEPEDRAERHHPHALARQLRAPAPVLGEEPQPEEDRVEPEVERRRVVHGRIRRRVVEHGLVRHEERERGGVAEPGKARKAVGLREEERELEPGGGAERFDENVEAEEGGRAVEVDRGHEVEREEPAEGEQRAGERRARPQHPDDEPRGQVDRAVEQVGAEEQQPVAPAEALGGDGDRALLPAPGDRVADGGSRRERSNPAVDFGRAAHAFPVYRHDLALVEPRHPRPRPRREADRRHDPVVEEHEAGERAADPGGARDRRARGERHRNERDGERRGAHGTWRPRRRGEALRHGRPPAEPTASGPGNAIAAQGDVARGPGRC